MLYDSFLRYFVKNYVLVISKILTDFANASRAPDIQLYSPAGPVKEIIFHNFILYWIGYGGRDGHMTIPPMHRSSYCNSHAAAYV